jgi:hypothetical protein
MQEVREALEQVRFRQPGTLQAKSFLKRVAKFNVDQYADKHIET